MNKFTDTNKNDMNLTLQGVNGMLNDLCECIDAVIQMLPEETHADNSGLIEMTAINLDDMTDTLTFDIPLKLLEKAGIQPNTSLIMNMGDGMITIEEPVCSDADELLCDCPKCRTLRAISDLIDELIYFGDALSEIDFE